MPRDDPEEGIECCRCHVRYIPHGSIVPSDTSLGCPHCRIAELEAIVEALPKCNRLNEAGELVCDKQVTPGMAVWLGELPACFRVTAIKICEVVEIGTGWDKANYRRVVADTLFDTREAAEAAMPAE